MRFRAPSSRPTKQKADDSSPTRLRDVARIRFRSLLPGAPDQVVEHLCLAVWGGLAAQRLSHAYVEHRSDLDKGDDANIVTDVRLEEEIRRREQRGREDGHDIDDWLRAETELTAQAMKTAA